MIIPWQNLETDTLKNLIADFVSRNGTDNGDDQSLESRIQQVLSQLKTEEALIVFDAESESVNILHRSEVRNADY